MKRLTLISVSASLWQSSVHCSHSQTFPPDLLNGTFLADNFSLSIRPNTTQWFAVEFSADLRSWAQLVNIVSTNRSVLFTDDTASTAERRFYRLAVPGTAVESAQALWRSQALAAYRFHLQRATPLSSPAVLTGTVSVINGSKTVTDVKANGEPTTDFKLEDFPSVEELFALLTASASQGVRLAWLMYDPSRGFVSRCVIDRRSGLSNDLAQYWVSNLEAVDGD